MTCIGPTAPPHDFGVVAVIDGNRLKVTPMRLANVPPPMAVHELSLHANAVDVVVSAKANLNILGVLFENALSFYEWRLPADFKQQPTLKWTAKMPSIVQVPSYLPCGFERCVNQSAFFDEEGQPSVLQTTCLRSHKVVAELQDDELQYSHRHSFDKYRVQKALQSAKQSTLLKHGKNLRSTEQYITLSTTGRLLAGTRELCRNCTSYLVTPSYLIFTTSQHLLKFVHMTEADRMIVPADTPEADERCRSLERGAKLVTVIPSIFALVLQMPRGNLETVYPRALMLTGIRDNIQEKKYRRAFLACRNHRVDMNILHDYNPDAFIADIKHFVDQVKKVEYIDLFLSQLR